jgi:hypothetical protein
MAFEIPDELETMREVKDFAFLHRSFRVGSMWRHVKSGNAEKFGHCVKAGVLSKESRCLRFEARSLDPPLWTRYTRLS